LLTHFAALGTATVSDALDPLRAPIGPGWTAADRGLDRPRWPGFAVTVALEPSPVNTAARTSSQARSPRLDRTTSADCCCSSAYSATARAHRLLIATEERIDPVVFRPPGCPFAVTNVCPNACRIHEPELFR
jgi:hypothetical protein